ncbi:hypothetical protein LSAT2_025236, partial [Lamellibrachia satsuma]
MLVYSFKRSGWRALLEGERMAQKQQPTKTYLNVGLEDEMEIRGYRPCRVKETISWIFIFLSLGALRLVFHWRPAWWLRLTKCPCDLSEAVLVLLQ